MKEKMHDNALVKWIDGDLHIEVQMRKDVIFVGSWSECIEHAYQSGALLVTLLDQLRESWKIDLGNSRTY